MSEFKQKLSDLTKRIEDEKGNGEKIKLTLSHKILVAAAVLAWFLLFAALVFKG